MTGLAARLYEEARETDPASRLVVEGLTLELLAQMARHSVSVAERRSPHWLLCVACWDPGPYLSAAESGKGTG